MNWVNVGSGKSLFGAKQLLEPLLPYCQLDPWEQLSLKFKSKFKTLFTKMHLKMSSAKWQTCCPGGRWVNKTTQETASCYLTHWGRATHICVGELTSIGSDNGLSPGRRQAIIWTNAGILLIGPLGTNSNEIFIEIHIFSFKKIHLKMSSGKWRPFCLGLNVLITLIP